MPQSAVPLNVHQTSIQPYGTPVNVYYTDTLEKYIMLITVLSKMFLCRVVHKLVSAILFFFLQVNHDVSPKFENNLFDSVL